MKKLLVIYCLLFLKITLASISSVVYKNVEGKNENAQKIISEEELLNAERLLKIHIVTTEQGKEITHSNEIIKIDRNGETISWKFKNSEIDIFAEKKQNLVILSSIEKGIKTTRTYNLRSQWRQSYFHGMEDFFLSSSNDLKFHAFGTTSHAKLKLGEFIAKKEHNAENLMVIMITFDDWKSAFWKGRVWFNKEQKKLVRYYEDKTWGTWHL